MFLLPFPLQCTSVWDIIRVEFVCLTDEPLLCTSILGLGVHFLASVL